MIRIYVANLAAYNSGILKGDWFELPVEMDVIFHTIFDEDELDENGQPYGDWAIHDYEAPFEISEYDSIEKLNEIAELMEQMTEEEIKIVSALVKELVVSDFEEGYRMLNRGDVIIHHANSMADIAYAYIIENDGFIDLNNPLLNYVDWESLGRDMAFEGTFIEVDTGLWVEVIN